jgi:hypothetical protein
MAVKVTHQSRIADTRFIWGVITLQSFLPGTWVRQHFSASISPIANALPLWGFDFGL